jgi:hypothetical protein
MFNDMAVKFMMLEAISRYMKVSQFGKNEVKSFTKIAEEVLEDFKDEHKQML